MKILACALLYATTALASSWAQMPPEGGYKVTRQFALGGAGGWDYLTFDPASRHLFIARDNRVMVVDPADGKLIAEIPGMQHAHGVALVPALHRAYVTNGNGNSVSVVDLATLRVVDRIAVSGKNPDAIIFDSATGHVLAMDGDSNAISVLDTHAGKEIKSIALAGNPEFAVSDGNGNVYVNLEDKGELAHVDIRTGTVKDVWPLAPCEGPTGLAFDAAHRRLFSVCANGWMIVTDAANGRQVAKLAVGKRPDAVAFDAKLGNVLSSSGSGVLDVIREVDADHYVSTAAVPTRIGARTLALDPQTHSVYSVSARDFGHDKPVKGFEMQVVGYQ